MFKPGHVEVERAPLGAHPGYHLSLDYSVRRSEVGTYVDFQLEGEVAGRVVHEAFSLHRDVAYNFMQNVGRCLRKHGLKPRQAPLFVFHGDYDRMFADLRAQLGARPGEPVDLQRFLFSDSAEGADQALYAALGDLAGPAG